MSIASALREVFAMFYRPLVRLVDVLSRIGLGLLEDRVGIRGELRSFVRSRQTSGAAEARGEGAEPSRISYPLVMETGDLPASWEQSTVTLLPVNPYLIHAYWYVRSGDLESVRGRMGDQPAQPALRVYDITDRVSCEGAGASFDIDIQLEAANWYVHLWSSARSYYVELGLRAEDGFYSVARSNVAQTPRAFPSEDVEARNAKLEAEHACTETLPPPDYGLQAKADVSPGAETSVALAPGAREAEASIAPGRDTTGDHTGAPLREEDGEARRGGQNSPERGPLAPVSCSDEKDLGDITANNEMRLDFGISSGKGQGWKRDTLP